MKPKASICLPVYNSEKYLEEAIRSILNQTYADFELVITDNASTDSSFDIAAGFNDSRIRLFRNDTTVRPSAANWNRCLEHAGGELIALYHSDDVYETTIVEKEVREFEKNPRLGAVFTGASIIDSGGARTGTMYMDKDLTGRNEIDFNLTFKKYLQEGKGSFVCPTAMIPKRVYDRIGGYDGKGFRFAFDYDLYFRVLEKYPVKILEEKLMSYRIYQEQDTKKVVTRGVELDEFYKLASKFLASSALTEKLDTDIIKSVRRGERRDLISCALSALKRGDIRRAAGLLMGARP